MSKIPNHEMWQFICNCYREFEHDNKGQRLGQLMFNNFSRSYPSIQVPESVDCYYDNKKIVDFINFISNVEV